MPKSTVGFENGFDPTPVRRTFSDPAKKQCQNEILGLAWADSQTLWTVEEGGQFRVWRIIDREPALIQDTPLDDPGLLWKLDPLMGMGIAASGELNAFELPSGRALWSEEQSSWVSALTSGTAMMRGKPRPILLTGHDDGSITIRKPKNGEVLGSFFSPAQKNAAPVSALAISPCGNSIGYADERRGLWVLDLPSGQWSEISTSFSPVAHKNRIVGLEWYPMATGEPTLFSFSWDGTVRIWDLVQKVPRMLLNSHQGPVLALGFAPRNKGHRPLLLSADEGSCIHLWDQGTYNLLGLPMEIASPAKFMAVSPDGNQVAWADNSRHLHVSHLDSLERSSTEIIPFDPADPRSLRNDLVLDQKSNQLIHRQSDGDVRLLPVDQDPASPAPPPLEFPGSKATAMAAAPGSGWIWLATSGNAPFWDTVAQASQGARILGLKKDPDQGWQVAQVLESGIGLVTSLALSETGEFLAVGSHLSDSVEIWQAPLGRPQHILGELWQGQTVQALAWGTGNLLAIGTVDPMATGGSPGHTYLWSGGEPSRIDKIPARVLAWNHDGQVLGRIDHAGRAWIQRRDQAAGAFSMLGEAHGVWQSMTFAPGSPLLALGGTNQVSIFDWKKDRWLGSIELPSSAMALWFEGDPENLWVSLKNDECMLISLESWLGEPECAEPGMIP